MFRLQRITGLCRVVLCLLLLATLAGCAASGQPGTSHQPAARQYDLSTAQDQLADFADNYITAVGSLYTQIERDQGNRIEVRREAIRSWLLTTRAAMINATDHNPVYGMVNMVILVRLERYSYAQPWFGQTFGASAVAPAREVMAEQDRHISALADQYLTPAQAEELRVAIDTWLKKRHPLRAVGLVRLQDLQVARGPEQAPAAPPDSIFSLAFVDPFASLAPAVREAYRSRLAVRRMFYYAQRLPAIVRNEAQLLSLDLLTEPQVADMLENVSKFNSNATAFLAVSRQLSDDVTRFPANLRAEREKTIQQLSDALTAQRDAALKQLTEVTARQREAAIQQVVEATSKERAAAIEQLTNSVDRVGRDLIDQLAQATAKERATTLRETGSTVSNQQRVAWADVDVVSKTFVTRLVIGLCLAAIIIAVSVALVVLGYRWIASRILPPAATPLRR